MIPKPILLLIFLLSPFFLGAQSSLGVNLRGNVPWSSLKETRGNGPGAGITLFGETDFEEGFRTRFTMGLDFWPEGDHQTLEKTKGKAMTGHVFGEVVYTLREYETGMPWGPYILGGIGVATWNIETLPASGPSTSLKTTKGALTLGFGYRFSRFLDVEIRGYASNVRSDYHVGWACVGVNFHF